MFFLDDGRNRKDKLMFKLTGERALMKRTNQRLDYFVAGLCLLLFGFLFLTGSHLHAEEQSLKQRYQRKFVPEEQMDAILTKYPRGVFLERKKFESLYKDAQDAAKNAGTSIEKNKAPSALYINQVQYTATVNKNQLLITAVLQISKPKAGWSILSLPTQGLLVESAKVKGKEAAFYQRGKQKNDAIFVTDETGEFSLTLKLSTPLKSIGSDLVASFGIGQRSCSQS